MLTLVLDTASPAITAGLAEVGEQVVMLSVRVSVDPRGHAERLTPNIAAVLAEAGATPADLTAVVAGLGPGPFTGLRVGLVTAVSIGQARGIPTYGVCTLDALGAAAGAGRVLVATDAKRREVYWASYTDGVRTGGPAVGRPADLTAQSGPADRAVGDGALRYAAELDLPVSEPRFPPAAALAALAADRIRAGAAGERLVPLYLRRPDAVPRGARKPVLSEGG